MADTKDFAAFWKGWHQSFGDCRAAIEGATIEATRYDIPEGADEPTLSLILRLKDGTKARVEVWRDDEGNGPGVLVPIEITRDVPHAPRPH